MAAPPDPDGGAPAESFLLSNQGAFVVVQDCLDFAAAFALLCCSRLAAELLDDRGSYRASARRLALLRSIPPYVVFGLRTEDEAQAIALHPEAVGAPEVPAEVLELAALAEPLEEESPACGRPAGRGVADAPRRPLAATGQAKLTWCFSQGVAAYEARDLETSERLLSAALDLAPEDDAVLCRLADTCYARCKAEEGELREALEVRTLELYRKAVRVNPSSSLGFNGLSLFQEGGDAKRHYLLRAVALDHGNSFALTNLAMSLLGEKDKDEVCLALLKRALAINPNLFYARPTIARLHLRLNELSEARDALAEQVRRRPEDEDSRCLHELLRRIV